MRHFAPRRRLLLVLLVLAGCNDERAAKTEPGAAAPRKIGGVYPDQWSCDSIATVEILGPLLGGTARALDASAPAERGLPRPCNYEVQSPEPVLWTFDIDCRDGMKQRADALFAQYREQSRLAIEQFHARPSGSKPRDERAPEPAVDVEVGAKGLDHRGQGLLFIDDDAPCYVRVVGKDAARRFYLAQLVAKNLTFANAPMTPRPLP